MNVFELFGSIVLKGGDEAARQIDKLDANGKKTSKTIGALEKATVLAGKAMKVAFIGGAAALSVLTIGLGKAVKEAADLEQVSTAYEVLIGDAEKAGKVIQQIKTASARTPFQFADLTKFGQTLMAFGTAEDVLVDKMMMLGDVSMGNSVKMESIVRAYGKIQAKGKATLEELNMLTENGVPILEALSNQYEVTTEEMFKMITAGVVGFDDVDQALRSMTEEGGQFFGMLDKQSRTFTGRISTLRDNIQMLFAEVGNRLLPVLGPAIDDMTSRIRTALADLTDGKGPLANFTEKIVRVVAWGINNIPKIGATFEYVGEVVGIVVESIKAAFSNIGDVISEFLEATGIKDSLQTVLEIAIAFVGDTYAALKKGVETGDWSDLFGQGIDLTKAVITIFATVKLAQTIGASISALFSQLLTAFAGTSLFATVKGVGVGGVVAGIALAIAIRETIQGPEGGWTKLIENIGAALAAGAVVGVITGNLAAGTMAFTIALNLKLGERVGSVVSELSESIKAGINDTELDSEVYGKAEGWGIELAKFIKQGITDAFAKDDAGEAIGWGAKYEEAFRKGFVLDKIWEDLSSSFETNWSITSANISAKWTEFVEESADIWNGITTGLKSSWSITVANALMWGRELTTSISNGITLAKDSIDAIGDKIWRWIKGGFGSALNFGEDLVDSLVEGFNKAKQRVIDWWDNLWNIEIKWNIFQSKSPPKVAIELGEDTANAFASGLESDSALSKIIDATKRWWAAISSPGTVDPDSIIETIFGGDSPEKIETQLDDTASQVETFWDRIVAAAQASGVSLANIQAQWQATMQSMFIDVAAFVTQVGYAFGSGTADWSELLGNFGDIMSSTFSTIFTTLISEIAKAIIAEDSWLVSTLANIATAIVGFLSQAFAALTAFFAFLGPAAPVAAGAVIATAIAAIAALGGLAISWIAPSETSTPDAGDDTAAASGGTQVSEITGPTRDLLVDLLTPLARLDSLTSIGNRIYDLLDERLIPGSATVRIDSVIINGEFDSDEAARQIEEALSTRIAFAQAGNG